MNSIERLSIAEYITNDDARHDALSDGEDETKVHKTKMDKASSLGLTKKGVIGTWTNIAVKEVG